MARIGFVACSKTKNAVRLPAAALYTSALFRKSLLAALDRSDKVYILSAKHGLLGCGDMVEPYDVTLKTMRLTERMAWGERTGAQLSAVLRPRDTAVLFCGEEYLAPLRAGFERLEVSVETPLGALSLGSRLGELGKINGEAALRDMGTRFSRLMNQVRVAQSGGRRMDETHGRQPWPARGVYFVLTGHGLERGKLPRIVRVGTHAVSRGSKTSLWDRLSTHRGTSAGGGSHRSSIFRLHVGRAWARFAANEIWPQSWINAFTQIIKRSPLTVTYNFDDSLEQMLALARSADESETTRGYEMVDRPNSQFRRQNSVIYHPNGCLPAVFENGASADVVFADDSFQDQLISAANGKYIHLSGHLFRNTCLLVGLSLEDTTLQSLLRQNAVQNPGNIHYIVQYTSSESKRHPKTEAAIFESNFESFGLYTLFLSGDEIKTLANVIEMEESTFAQRHARHKPKFIYYMVGSVGAGKSTAAGHFRNLITYDEWVDERKPDLARPEGDVAAEKISGLNEWIAEQFHKKNFALQACKECIHVVDRAPLDPLSFGPNEDRPKKAKALVEKITDHGTWRIEPGHIIELEASLEEIQIRNSLKHKYWPDDEYEKLMRDIKEVYGSLPRSTICTTGRSAAEVAKHVARIIFLQEYRPVEFQDELERHASNVPVDVKN